MTFELDELVRAANARATGATIHDVRSACAALTGTFELLERKIDARAPSDEIASWEKDLRFRRRILELFLNGEAMVEAKRKARGEFYPVLR